MLNGLYSKLSLLMQLFVTAILREKKQRKPLQVSIKFKRQFLSYLRYKRVRYSNDRSIFRLGHFVIKFSDDGYLIAYTPTPSLFRFTHVDMLSSLAIPVCTPDIMLKKLDEYHVRIFKVSLL